METNSGIIYLRHTDNSGRSHVACHVVWNRDLFITSVSSEAIKNGGSVAAATEADYRKEKWPKHSAH